MTTMQHIAIVIVFASTIALIASEMSFDELNSDNDDELINYIANHIGFRFRRNWHSSNTMPNLASVITTIIDNDVELKPIKILLIE